jgi:hypothetical protein
MMQVIALQLGSVGTRVCYASDCKMFHVRSVKSVDVKSKLAPHRYGLSKVLTRKTRSDLIVGSYPRIGLELSQG